MNDGGFQAQLSVSGDLQYVVVIYHQPGTGDCALSDGGLKAKL